MKQVELVAQKAKELGITTTKLQYVLISKIMAEKSVDISPEECMEICNLQRYCRMVLKSDEVAMELEKSWHGSPQLFQFEQESRQVSKRYERDRLLHG